MDLLIVPLALVGIGLLFSMLQDTRQQNLENQRQEQALVIENQRAKAERELAEKRADDEALQAYLDQMSGLLLERDLRTSKEHREVRTLARARTLTVLSRLDPSGKTALMQFLVEAGLVQRVDGRNPIIDLYGADLSDANLNDPGFLQGANLSEADLSGADLSNALMVNANLLDANLIGADLHLDDLSNATLTNANLTNANLHYADLSGATLSDADLTNANLRRADLNEADLSYADLGNADLGSADLRDADLSGANLSDADLNGAKLSRAEGITNEELEQQAADLKGATMPNGQKYEDWLKDREKRQQDE